MFYCKSSLPWISLVLACLFFQSARGTDEQTRLGDHKIERTVQLRTHSIYAPYIDQDLQNRWWDFGADSYVNTNKYIRLTRNAPSLMGWLWSRLPISSNNFVIEVEFKVSGDSTHLYGDGMAMWLTTERTQPGPVFGNQDKFNGLGIFVDTYANSRHGYSFPRIGGMMGDGETSYNVGNDGDGQMLGGCTANIRRTNVATKLKVTYLKEKLLDVKIQYKGWDEWTDCFSVKNVTLPGNPFVGFSAMTGDVSDAHDIISVTSYSAILGASDKSTASAKKSQKWTSNTESTSWSGLFFRFIVFVGLCAGCFFGYKEYLRRNAHVGIGNFGGANYGGMYTNNKRF